MNDIKSQLRSSAPAIFEKTPVCFAYVYGSYIKALSHPFSDLDIGIYIKTGGLKSCLDLELSLALLFDEHLDHRIQSEVRILNHLPLSVNGRILSEAKLIYSRDEDQRVAFETRVRSAYFDFLPVLYQHRQAYLKKTIAEYRHGIH